MVAIHIRVLGHHSRHIEAAAGKGLGTHGYLPRLEGIRQETYSPGCQIGGRRAVGYMYSTITVAIVPTQY